MLQFIVLGQVPGTHLQVTFAWFLILGIIVDAAFGLYYAYNTFWIRRHNLAADEKSVSELAVTN